MRCPELDGAAHLLDRKKPAWTFIKHLAGISNRICTKKKSGIKSRERERERGERKRTDLEVDEDDDGGAMAGDGCQIR